MFSPKYSVTNKILDGIVKIELDLFYLKSVEIPVEWERRLKSEMLIKKVLGGAKLEGMAVGLDVVTKIVADDPDRDEKIEHIASRLDITVRERDLQMILNLINTNKLVDQISYISSRFAQERVMLKEMFQINRLIGERMFSVDGIGVFRSGEIVGNYTGAHPSANEVSYQMEDFMAWFEHVEKESVHPVIKFSVSAGELLRIVPFENYNLVSVLLFSMASLGSVGYGITYISIEEEVQRTKDKLTELIANLEKNSWDLTEVIEYLVGVLQTCISRAKVRVSNIEGVSAKYRSGSGRAVALSERQLLIMEEITGRSEMTIKQMREVLPLVSDDTILRDLKDLVNKKMIRKRGKTKGAVYLLGKAKNI